MGVENKHILMIGCFDTKGEDFTYLFECIRTMGEEVIAINTGVMKTAVNFQVNFDNKKVADGSGTSLDSIPRSNGLSGLSGNWWPEIRIHHIMILFKFVDSSFEPFQTYDQFRYDFVLVDNDKIRHYLLRSKFIRTFFSIFRN